MRDPFPPPSAILSRLTLPLATRLSLRTLPLHVHQVLLGFSTYHAINLVLSPFLSRRLCPQTYPHLPTRTKVSWNAHVVSFVQSVFICTMALWVIWNDRERMQMTGRERVWGYTGATGMVQGFSAGYFLWDLWTGIVDLDIHGWGLMMHATSALLISGLGFRPFLNYYGLNFVLYELSTPFLNIHWFLDKLGMTGSSSQLINGIILITTFGGSRLVWGIYQSINMYRDVWSALQRSEELPVPPWLALAYLASTSLLSVLNVYWFARMIKTVSARFEKPKAKPNPEEEAKEKKKR